MMDDWRGSATALKEDGDGGRGCGAEVLRWCGGAVVVVVAAAAVPYQ